MDAQREIDADGVIMVRAKPAVRTNNHPFSTFRKVSSSLGGYLLFPPAIHTVNPSLPMWTILGFSDRKLSHTFHLQWRFVTQRLMRSLAVVEHLNELRDPVSRHITSCH